MSVTWLVVTRQWQREYQSALQLIRRVGASSSVLACLALACVYLAVMGGHSYSIDGLLMYRQAVSIVTDHSLRFAAPIYWGDVYSSSKYGIGLSLLYLPGVILLTALGLPIPVPRAGVYDWDLLYADPVYTWGAAPVHIVVTVVTAFLVARFVRELGYGSRVALLAVTAFGIASPAIVYGRGDFSQPLLGMCLIGGLLATVRFRRTLRMAPLMGAGACLTLAVLTRPLEGSFLLPALVSLIIPGLTAERRRPETYRAVVTLVGAFALGVALTLVVNVGRFGSPLETGYTAISWGTQPWIGLPGVLVSPSRGIVWQFPLAILAPLGLRGLWLSGWRAVSVVIGTLSIALLVNTALWVPWWGAQSWGSRLFVPALPMLAAAAAIGAWSVQANLRLRVVAVLTAGGALWALPGTLTDLLGGYAARYDGSAQSFALSGYPPVSGWRYVHHIWAASVTDANSIDIVWFRIARATDYLSLLVPAVLLGLAVVLAFRVVRMERESSTLSVSPPPPQQPEPTSG